MALKICSYVLSTLHAVAAIFVWLEMTFVSCPLPGKTYFDSFTCLNYCSPGMQVGMLITLSYLISDMVLAKVAFGPGNTFNETLFHHIIGLIGLVSALVIGRIVAVIAICLLIAEISTIFLNNRHILKELDLIEKHDKFHFWNGITLILSFFFIRVVFYGVFLGCYILPAFFNYPYNETAKEIGWFKVRWAQTLMILFIILYLLNIYWFKKLVQGYLKYR